MLCTGGVIKAVEEGGGAMSSLHLPTGQLPSAGGVQVEDPHIGHTDIVGFKENQQMFIVSLETIRNLYWCNSSVVTMSSVYVPIRQTRTVATSTDASVDTRSTGRWKAMVEAVTRLALLAKSYVEESPMTLPISLPRLEAGATGSPQDGSIATSDILIWIRKIEAIMVR